MNWNRIQGPILWGKLIRAIFGISLAILLSKLALFGAQLSEPLHKVSLFVLAITLVITLFSIRALWLWIRSLTIFSIMKFTIMLYVIPVLVIAVATTGEDGFLQALIRAALQVPSAMGQWSSRGLAAIARYPVEFSHAYNNRNADASIDAVTANETTTLTVKIPSSASAVKSFTTNGMLVTMNLQAKTSCQLDAMSDETFFSTKDALVVMEGPRYEEGVIWWRIQNDAGSAWCAADVLEGP